MSGSPKSAQVFELTQLSPDVKALCLASVEARNASYSPYSKFKVGAALVK